MLQNHVVVTWGHGGRFNLCVRVDRRKGCLLKRYEDGGNRIQLFMVDSRRESVRSFSAARKINVLQGGTTGIERSLRVFAKVRTARCKKRVPMQKL